MPAFRFSIGELSREFSVTPRAIRFYEDAGLLTPTRNGRQRVYSPRDRVHLMLILRGKRLGFSLKEIGDMLKLYDAPNGERSQLCVFIDKIRNKRTVLLGQREDIDAVLAEMDQLEERCNEILQEEPLDDTA